jgi:hypothetical protein
MKKRNLIFLYRYVSLNDGHKGNPGDRRIDWLLESFERRSLYFRSIDQFNDPFELSYDLPPTDKKSLWMQLGKNSRRDGLIKDHGVACLSKRPDNLLLWAHYADGFKGVCIGYLGNEEIMKNAEPVEYRTRLPIGNPTDAELLHIKSMHWMYEEEYRIVSKNYVNDWSSDGSAEPREIIFGNRISDENKAAIQNATKSLGVKYFEVSGINSDYTISLYSKAQSLRDKRTLKNIASKLVQNRKSPIQLKKT